MAKRVNYIYNKKPKFEIPKNNKQRPAFILYAMKKSYEVDVARSELNYVTQPKNIKTGKPIIRMRRLNEHRAGAMRAMVPAMLYHFNIVSQIVQASVEQLSDECGLSTISSSGNKSISRASRLITEFMEPMGFVVSEKKWDKIIGNYMPKMISLTPLFFKLFDVSEEKINSAKKQQLAWINRNLIKKGIKPISLIEAKFKSQEVRLQSILNYRKSQHFFHIRKKKAQNIFSLDEKTARQKILKLIVEKYSLNELSEMGLDGLRKKVNIQYYYLKKIAKENYSDSNI
ncbi:plasmid replication initiator RepA [Buchnera aphidicola]|uniref:plasmid replication initiator RepA n=1 Tax=Buchnera aphidicola TaxID=9 RepID=UPI003464D282